MADKEKPLPKPHKRRFGRKGSVREEGTGPLLADAIARASAEGKLEEFLEVGIPQSEEARKLVSMMMGMTGMAMGTGSLPEAERGGETAQPQIPEDVRRAVEAGDVKGLTELLQRGYGEDVSSPERPPADEEKKGRGGRAAIEKEIIDQVIGIASDNNLSPDWIILRAIKLYVEEYRRTGRL